MGTIHHYRTSDKPEQIGDVFVLDGKEYASCDYPWGDEEYFENKKSRIRLDGEWVVYKTDAHSPVTEPQRMIPKFWCGKLNRESRLVIIQNPPDFYAFEKGSFWWDGAKVVDWIDVTEYKKSTKT